MSHLHLAVLVAFGLAGAPVAATQTPVLQAPQVSGAIGSGLYARDIAVADVDEDGHPDVVAATATETRLVLGTPDGPYGANVPFLSGGGLNVCQFADLDGDGRPDIVRAKGSVVVQHNLGGGVFGTAQVLTTSAAVTALCIADLDGDGDLDLVAGLDGKTRIAVFLDNGAGVFGPKVEAVAPLSVARIAAGDFDGDGTLDLAMHDNKPLSGSIHQAYVMLGEGGGTFNGPVDWVAPGIHAIDLAVADFTGDGLDDVAVSQKDGDISVYAGDAQLTMAVAFTLPAVGSQPLLVTGDVSGDGLPDLVQNFESVLATHLGTQGGGLGPAIGGACSIDTFPLALADLDRDGRLDVAAEHSTLNLISATLGNGDGTWRSASPATPNGTGAIEDAALADFDGDGRLDLAEAYASGDSATLRPGVLDGSFGPSQPLPFGPDLVRLFANDSTGDGSPDLIVAATAPSASLEGRLALAVGDGRLGFTLLPPVTPSFWLLDAEPADMNGDGRTDVLAIESTGTGGAVEVLLNGGDGSFTSAGVITTPTVPLDVDAGDLDHDGDLDLVLAYAPSSGFGSISTMFVYTNAGGTFTQSSSPSMPSIRDLLLHDVDGDGNLDALGVAQLDQFSRDGNLLIRPGIADSTFGTLQTYAVPGEFPSFLTSIALAELDGDAEAEVLVGGTQQLTPVFVYDLVGGAPVQKERHTCGLGTIRFLPTDVNGDGWTDVVVVTPSLGALFELRNTLGPWARLGFPISGTAGDSLLVGEGTLQPGSPLKVSIVGAKPSTATLLVVGLTELGAPFKGGVMVPTPTLVLPIGPTDAAGNRSLATTWPASLPSGFSIVMQAWQSDAAAPAGFAATNGLRGTTP